MLLTNFLLTDRPLGFHVLSGVVETFLLLGSAREWYGSTSISPVWLEGYNTYIYLSLATSDSSAHSGTHRLVLLCYDDTVSSLGSARGCPGST